ncbi:MAG: universal stress protein [Desulfocucumaceae bacterium]
MVYKKILIPIDGSEGSGLALDHCLKMLDNERPEKVVLFHVLNYPRQLDTYSGKMLAAMKKMKEQLAEHGDKILLDAKSKMAEKNTGTSVEAKLIWGDPKYEIVKEAEEGKYDLLIIGSRGLSGIKSFLLGSVGNHVAQNVKCTVILVKE